MVPLGAVDAAAAGVQVVQHLPGNAHAVVLNAHLQGVLPHLHMNLQQTVLLFPGEAVDHGVLHKGLHEQLVHPAAQSLGRDLDFTAETAFQPVLMDKQILFQPGGFFLHRYDRIGIINAVAQRLAVSLENEREDIKREMLSPTGWDSIYSLSGPDRIKILTLDGHRELEGMTLSEIGEEWRMDPLDALLDILSDETGKAVMMDITESRDNLVKIMRHPLSSFGTDSLFSSDTPHPRTKDAAMHLIREYVSKEKVLSLQEAVRKMSGENADRLNLNDRGYVKEGMKADLVLFDAEKGVVDTVLVNGKAVIRDGIYSGGLYGTVVSRGR